jgi:hypothetical protein
MPLDYKVQQGDCISSISFAHGFDPRAVWDHPQNAELRTLRGSPNVLLPGDMVFVPDRQPKTVAVTTGRQHRFRRQGVPEVLRLQFLDAEGQARAGLPYTLSIGELRRQGTTGTDGALKEPIPPDARLARIALGEGEEEQIFEIRLGELDPASEVTGFQARLNSLGYACGEEDGTVGSHTRIALADFQRDHEIEVTGEPDKATLGKIEETYRGRAR